MDTKDLIKAGILVFLYFIAAPLLGLAISRVRLLQRAVFGVMCFMTISGFLGPAEWGLTISFDPTYRGHARGFHFFFSEALALALIVASVFAPKVRTRFLPPGLWLYVLYCALSMISIINAPVQIYVWMAALKAVKIMVFFVAAYNFFRDEEDIHFFLKVMSLTMMWEAVVVLKMKYMDGLYQVWGTFEHQNSLCMYTTMIGMVLLGTALVPKQHRNSNLYLAGYLACAVVVQSTLSRAGLVIFAGGTAGMIVLSFIEKVTRRRVLVVSALGAVACIGLVFAADSIIERFLDRANFASNMDRKLLNKASANILRDYPLGVGWNNYGAVIDPPIYYGKVMDDYYRSLGMHVDPTEKKSISESHYWLLLAETGYQGFISYMVFISVFFWWSLRGAWAFRRLFLGCFSLGVAMGFSVNYAQSLLERVLTQPRNMMLWFILLAATSRIEVWRKAMVRQQRRAQATRIPPTDRRALPERTPVTKDELLNRREKGVTSAP